MTGCSPELVAYADQRIASASRFLNEMTTELVATHDVSNPNDSVETLTLSHILMDVYKRNGSNPETTCDALALALRQLAAKKRGVAK